MTTMTAMTKNKQKQSTVLAGALALAALGATASAQSSDALIEKLLDKGILTVKEANELRQESDKDFTKAYSLKTGLPDWVTGLKFNGDFRGRFEKNSAENTAYIDRNRYRYRLRLGWTATMVDNFDVGFRLASGNPQFNPAGTLVGGAPITANQDLGSLNSRKFIWIDTAFARWTPIKNDKWTISTTIGKMDNPFALSNMIFDYDINPEGAALQVAYHINDQHVVKANAAAIVLDEINQGVGAVPSIGASHDPALLGGQVYVESKWSPKFETSLGMAMFSLKSKDSLSAKVQPFYNSGNSRDGILGLDTRLLKYNYNPIIGTAAATYKLDSFPLYEGAFPIKVLGEYMSNPGAPTQNQAYRAGVVLGKAGHKHAWEISYRYQRLEADAWFDALVDDDNGAFYAKDAAGNPGPQLAGTGKGDGWFGGTNVKGHLMQATYSFTDFLNLTLTYYKNELIIGTPGQSSSAGHFMADIMWKF